MNKNEILKGSIKTGVINAVINGGIQYFFLKGHGSIPVSVDSITNTNETVLGTAVVLAISIAIILTVVQYFIIKTPKVKFFPTAFWLTLKHAFFTFGIITSLAVLWQRYMGTVEVSLIIALIILGLIAGIVSGIVNYLTIKNCVISEKQTDQLIQ
ncbi:hypothetical protein SAMN05660776_2668 [Salegentibacter holothuriorum]|uniref:Uncharacterized protein n=1 Tax=Salegentibacter holothuriorum TaxID=241145 RepID=A0A1T5DIT9_9FLAO|nr:hypothetical protein [Salegentibacter holothuriorum]SKB71609.1 hypothetical protein SAMN05660776_2668 [Salegentibacter holothuriorum]